VQLLLIEPAHLLVLAVLTTMKQVVLLVEDVLSVTTNVLSVQVLQQLVLVVLISLEKEPPVYVKILSIISTLLQIVNLVNTRV